ncbi:MAG TPA: 50S ribosomal protein L4 [Anaerohalosphaeraceae bacterium]|nr:50S ribosomal protein L4 [Anaerohalosphaeraceae bacterium]HQG05301.1 50S ribosomal protein L4 [Anaerohalosphaeraceae bacterium]HQI07019.1 50S ribosomal protein L4 [Anaerohalosphaeraceae bacterium]HQJ66715.1 50S ribosomal protein L4 [Anaerohalosphaeraceae bacterium]
MIDVAVYNREGQEVERIQVNEELLDGQVRSALLKQAIVMYHANQRVGTAATKNRGRVEGSTRKIYRQKGTGNARMGTVRTPIRKGGGVAFAKLPRDFSQRMPKKQRRLARDSAILSKLQSGQVVVVDELNFTQPKTREFARILKNLKIDRSCLVAIPQQDVNLYKSARNVPKVDVMVISDLNAGDICSKKKMLFTKDAFLSVVNRQSPLN